MPVAADVNITNAVAFLVARNLDVEGYYGLTILLTFWLIGFFILINKGIWRAVAFSTMGVAFLAITMRFMCANLINNGGQVCLLSDKHMWSTIVLAAVFGAMMYFKEESS